MESYLKNKIDRIVENALEEVYSSPDTIHISDNEKKVWTDKDAIPFFVLRDGKIIYGDPKKRHIDYYKDMKYSQRYDFSNHIILQGRFWQSKNYFSFWYIDEDYYYEMIHSVVDICEKNNLDPLSATIFYYHEKYHLVKGKNEDEYFISTERNIANPSNDVESERPSSIDERNVYIDHWMNQNSEFQNNNFRVISSDKHGNITLKPFNKFELLLATVHDVYNCFLKDDSSKQFSMKDFDLYLYKKFHIRLKTMLHLFHDRLRRKIVNIHNGRDNKDDRYDPSSNLEKFAMSVGLDFDDFKIVYYAGTNDDVYSLEVKTPDKEKIDNLIDAVHNDENSNFIIDRTFSYKVGNEITLYLARIREKSH